MTNAYTLVVTEFTLAFSDVCVAQSLVSCIVVLYIIVVIFILFLLSIVLSVILRLTPSG